MKGRREEVGQKTSIYGDARLPPDLFVLGEEEWAGGFWLIVQKLVKF